MFWCSGNGQVLLVNEINEFYDCQLSQYVIDSGDVDKQTGCQSKSGTFVVVWSPTKSLEYRRKVDSLKSDSFFRNHGNESRLSLSLGNWVDEDR